MSSAPPLLDLLRLAAPDLAHHERVIVVALRDLGMTHAANAGVYDVLGATTASASLAVPCPWAREAAARYRGEDIGVQLTLNAQHQLYRWGPLTHAPSLVDGNGGFPATAAELWDHGDLDEVRREARAQIERAITWGFDVTHVASHLDALVLRPEFFDVLLDLAVDFRLPLALPDPSVSDRAGFPVRRLAAAEGVLFTDHVVDLTHTVTTAEQLAGTLDRLGPGVTELRFAPAVDSPELRALSDLWPAEQSQREVLSLPGALRTIADEAGIAIATFRQLRAAQRLL